MVGNLPVAKPKLLAKSQTMTMICDYSYTIESHTRLVKRTKLYYQGCKNKEMKTYWESSFYPKASSVHRKTRKTFRDIFSKSLALLLNSSLRQPIELFQLPPQRNWDFTKSRYFEQIRNIRNSIPKRRVWPSMPPPLWTLPDQEKN